jgi:glycosyltransferase involved in cell wall biosynthesis
MPCLNEAETLEGCIRAAGGWLSSSGCAGEIVAADNGSTDGSVEIAERCGARVVHVPMRGYGAALYFGSRAALGRYIIMGDSDLSYDFSHLSPFVDRLRAGDDLVMGNRFLGGIARGAMPLKNRYSGNPLPSALGRLFFRAPIGDFYCGLRGFGQDAFERMDLRTTGMEFASEMVIKATVLGMRISEVPTTLQPDGRSPKPHLRPWLDGWRGLRYMLLCSPRWLFLYPGLAAMFVGVAVGAWLFVSPRRIGHATLDVHTLLYCGVFVLLGYQAILFSVFSRLYAAQHRLLPPSRRLEAASATFDFAFSSGVFHRVVPGERLRWAKELRRVLAQGGRFCLFEHNPLNPLTVQVVRRIPFDRDAKLLRAREARTLLRQAGFAVGSLHYYFFFPRALRALRRLEPLLRRVPAGAQYFVVGQAR